MEKKRKKFGLGLASLIFGLLTLFCFPFGPVAVICSIVALVKSSARPDVYGGRKLAITGLVVGSLFLFINILVTFVVVPGSIGTIERGSQRRTMSDMRTIGIAWESFAKDHRTCCPGEGSFPELSWGNLTGERLETMLVPNYLKKLPAGDAWGKDFQYAVSCPEGDQTSHYMIRSAGRNGKWDGDDYTEGTRTKSYDCDIVYMDGRFICWPEGLNP